MKYKFNPEQYEEIRIARKQNRDKQIDSRLKVLELRSEGKGLEEIADITGFHRSYVSNIIRKYFEEGLQAVAEKHYHGNRRNMSIEEEAQFLEQFCAMTEQGHELDIQRIRDAYEKKAGHNISCAQVYRVLHRHGWRKMMPRSKHPKKASEEDFATSNNTAAKLNG